MNIYTREFDSGKVVLGGNKSGGAENAWSMYVLFASPSDSPPDPLGSLEVSASTAGDNQDSDGYAVTVGGSTSKEIDPNGSATFSGLNEGNHRVELTGLEADCSVAGQNPRTLSVEAALRPAPPSPSTAKPVAFPRSKCLLKETGRTRPPSLSRARPGPGILGLQGPLPHPS